jgi:Fe-S cluster biosynthesis and repair protein YggX
MTDSNTSTNRIVYCEVLKREAPGLARAPHPGEIGKRIYENVSEEGWNQWLQQLTMIINEYGLNTADPKAYSLIEDHMMGFLFGEGDKGGSQGFAPPAKK